MSKLRRVEDQVIVITGASSGIGLATALMAGKKGATVVVSSRNARELDKTVRAIRAAGGEALAVTADVTSYDDMKDLARKTVRQFGRIDTWVNNAGISIFGPVLDTPLAEAHQLFETNFWGVHYGCLAAIEAMKDSGGVIVNVGSEVSERAVMPQTFYSASKHAVKGYSEGLRTELHKKGFPIRVSLVRPSGIDTPFTQHAVNHLEKGEPSLPSSVYHPDLVAEAILACAETGKRDVFVGGSAKFFKVFEHLAPGLLDYLVEGISEKSERGARLPHTEENEGLMHAPAREGFIRGGHKGRVKTSSAWTSASLNPLKTSLAFVALGGVAWLGAFAARRERQDVGARKAA